MKIKPVWFLSSIVILMELGFTRLIPVASLQNVWLSYKYISILCAMVFLYSIMSEPVLHRDDFYGKYAFFVLFFFFVESMFPIFEYNAPINEVLSSGIRFLVLLLPAVLVKRIDAFEFEKFLKFVISATIAMLIFRFVLWVIYTQTNQTPFVEIFYYYRYYFGIYRLDGSALCLPVLIYEWYKFLDTKNSTNKVRNLLAVALCVGYVLVVNQSRAMAVCVIVVLLSMWLTISMNIKWKVFSVVIGIVAIIAILNSVYFADLVESLSPENAVYGGSTLVRTHAIEYYYNQNGISLLGYGFLPASNTFIQILRGAEENFYFEDLGFLGILFSNGLLGVVLYLIPILRILKLYIQMKKKRDFSATFMLGVLIYNVACALSLSQFDAQRIVGFVFVICLTEYLYYKNISEEVQVIEREY